MRNWPLISIITACYNSEKYIEDTILSVIKQTYPNIEYIIVDGASKDRTMAIVSKYKDRIAKIISEPDDGIYDAFNKGIQASTGDVIYFLNSDDYLFNNQIIAEIAGEFYHNPHLKVVYGNVEFRNDFTDFAYIKGNQQHTIEDIKKDIIPQHPGFFAKKELFGKNLFDVRYKIASDRDWLINVFKNYPNDISYVDKTVSIFRAGGISSNIKALRETKEEINLVYQKHFAANFYDDIEGAVSDDCLKRWLEVKLIHDRNISETLDEKIKNVAIFGSMDIALYLLEDLRKTGINVLVILDNSKYRCGRIMRGVPIEHPNWLTDNYHKLDAVIFSFIADHDQQVREQIKAIIGKDNGVPIFSWKDMIAASYS